MNKFLKYMTCCLLLLLAVSCLQEDILGTAGDESIVLTFDSGAMTKAADTDAEAYVAHVDVLVYNTSEVKVYHERVVNNGNTTFTLAARRSSFDENTGYYVYLIANSSASADTFSALTDVEDLRDMVQEDQEIMFANISADAAHNFLMDAVAYTGNTEPATPGTVVLYDGVDSNSTYLNAVFRRAAAKVYVTINKGGDVTFADAQDRASAAYYMRNCPVSTTVIDGYNINTVLATQDPAPQNPNFVWTDNKITLATYAYEYNWENQSIQDKETSLVVNIPMVVTAGGTSEVRTGNWYKVPVSKTSSFERNHIYSVEVTVNALGAITPEQPEPLDDVRYSVADWQEVGVTVGDVNNNPEYLQLNTDHVDMYNVNVDNSTLEFASSSEIVEIRLEEAYFYNYLDKKVSVQSYNSTAYQGIKAEADNGLNGGITITSPFVNPDYHSNAIRYLEFTVVNKTNQTAKFTVSQYPIIYITNELGYYSYRDDFNMSYKNPEVPDEDENFAGVSWRNGGWSYNDNPTGNDIFFASKVRLSDNPNNAGNYTLGYAYYIHNASWGQSKGWNTSSLANTFDNPRMYHVHVTATSGSYVLARPRLDAEGYTEDSEENAMLVSPSFMIASQLGATALGGARLDGGIAQAKGHCKEYVETVSNGDGTVTVYDDWRLPTAAEIDIIMKHQDTSDAMEIVLNGLYYYCAFNPDADTRDSSLNRNENDRVNKYPYTKYNEDQMGGSHHVRCIRDAY